MIRPYLIDLINEHKPIDDDDTDCAEWEIQILKKLAPYIQKVNQ